MTVRASMALLAALATASCASPLMKLPAGPGVPATDGAAVINQALAACRAINTISAELSVRGKVGGRGIRARLLAGLASPASAYIEAPAPFGAPIFVFAARDADATLLLPRDRRVLEHGRPSDVLEAIAGVPLGPADLRAALTGCAPMSNVAGSAAQALGENWRLIPGDRELYLHRDRSTDPWRLVAVRYRERGQLEWRAEYRDFVSGLSRTVRLASTESGRFDLTLSVSQVEINVALDAGTFIIQIPAGTAPITIEELRDAGPLAEPSTSK